MRHSESRRGRVLAGATAVVVALAVWSIPIASSAAPTTKTAPKASPAAGAGWLTRDQALAKARVTGKAVPVTGETTDSSTLTARPDGTLALSEMAVPVRKLVGANWVGLDPTLHLAADGTVAPAVTTSPLTISGGGTSPLARLGVRGRSLALSLAVNLPNPTLSGPTATYTNVLPGVDLQATADAQGGFSDVLIVRTAAAAANPALAKLVLSTTTDGVRLSADTAGNILGVNAAGQTTFIAPTPQMWDSASPSTTPATATEPSTGRTLDATTKQPVRSTTAGPGEAAHTAPLGVSVTASAITLTPAAAILHAPNPQLPIFIDPFVQPVTNPGKTGYASISSGFPTTNRWNSTTDPDSSELQVGYEGDWAARSLVNFPIYNSTLAGASIMSATFKITEDYSWQCSTSGKTVNLYAPGTTLTSSNATWNNWSGVSLGSVVDSDGRAVGHDSGCPAAGIPFVVTGPVAAAVTAKKTTQTFVLKDATESDVTYWKKFDKNTATLEIDYDHAPTTNSPGTSPATSCTANNTVGLGNVTLHTNATDTDGGVLGVMFKIVNTGTGAVVDSTDPSTNTVTTTRTAPTATASHIVLESKLAANAAGVATEYTWQANVTDYHATSSTITCHFTFDPTTPGTPTVAPPSTFTYGLSAMFTITKPLDSPVIPANYLVQLNDSPSFSVSADSSGNASASVTPSRVHGNFVSITSLSAGNNIGQTYIDTFDAAAPTTTQADGDVTRDGLPDYLAVGSQNTLPPGIWLAANTIDGISPNAANIGVSGLELDHNPSDFTGYAAITGNFNDLGDQDIIVYNRTTGDEAMYPLFDDGAALPATAFQISPGNLTDLDGLSVPQQVVNGGHTGGTDGALPPDLFGVFATHLAYFTSGGAVNNYSVNTVSDSTATTPTGGTDWANWTIATAQTATSGTDMFLWNKGSGGLYLWTNMAYDPDAGTLSFVQHTLSTAGWDPTSTAIQAADINHDGVPDLWVTNSTGQVTAYLVSNATSPTPTLTAQPPRILATATHSWALNDIGAANAGDTVAATADVTSGTAQPLSGASGAVWNTGDLFDPDVQFSGAAGARLATAAFAVDTAASFTVSAWIKPAIGGGTFLTQDGTNTAAFKAWVEPSDNSWRAAMSGTNVASPTWSTAATAPNSVTYNTWTHVTITYDHAAASLTINTTTNVARVADPTTWHATGQFSIGGSAHTTWLHGQVANVQVWNRSLAPNGVTGIAAVYGVLSTGQLTYTRIDVATGDRISAITSSTSLPFVPKTLAVLNANTLLMTAADGHLRRVDITANSNALTFATPVDLGTGWGSFDLLTFDGNKHLYGIVKSTGALHRYDVNAAKPVQADIANFTTIDTGFGSFVTWTSTGTDWLIGTTDAGVLRGYHVTGAGAWTGATLADHGWTGPTFLMSPGAGVIFANSAQAMYHYLDLKPFDASGADIQYYLSDPVDSSGWTQVLLSAQPNSVH
jgi:hypothetical protein